MAIMVGDDGNNSLVGTSGRDLIYRSAATTLSMQILGAETLLMVGADPTRSAMPIRVFMIAPSDWKRAWERVRAQVSLRDPLPVWGDSHDRQSRRLSHRGFRHFPLVG